MAAAIGVALAATAWLIAAEGLVFPLRDAAQPAVIAAGLALGAAYYHRRGAGNFVVTLEALAALVAFSSVYATMMYAIAATARPWADTALAGFDAALGFSAPRVVAWVDARPAAAVSLEFAYFSVMPQTALAIMWLGLRDRREALERFVLRFMAAAAIAAIVFFVAPAQGTCAHYGFAAPDHYRPILVDLEAMRSGSRTLATWRGAEGLITFPSFHTSWGLLLILAFWRERSLKWPILGVNAVMIASTVPIGMHYLADVLGGAAVVALVVAAGSCLKRARIHFCATRHYSLRQFAAWGRIRHGLWREI